MSTAKKLDFNSPFDIKAPLKKDYDSIIPGSLIRVRGENWQVRRKRKFLEKESRSHFEVECVGLTGIVSGYKAVFLSNIDDITLIQPEDITLKTDTSDRFSHSRLYLESLLRHLPIREDDKICVAQKGVFDPKEYQYAPALKALSMPRPRILIGDGVGLGKTIEIGILLSELIKRGKGKRILVVTPKAILSQFQRELFTRFGVALTRLDSDGIAKLKRILPSTINPFMFHDRVIVSMDTLKNDRYLLALENCHWDTLIIDECHNVAIKGGNIKNQRARLAKKLAQNAEAVILASATPHDGTKEGFASLIKLLDPTAIEDETNYSFDDINRYFIRRTKIDVIEEISGGKKRENQIAEFSLSKKEEAVLLELSELRLKEDENLKNRKIRRSGFKELFKTTLIKAYLSSPHALIETVENKLKRSKNLTSDDRTQLENIITLAKDAMSAGFSKEDKLMEMIKGLGKDKKVVLFTERIATLKFLEEKLSKLGEVLKMDGGMSDVDLMEVASNFKSQKHQARFLVATNVASEGLNLHHACHHLVHFDLPWSFITLEQRNGRIDRIGQEEIPYLYYMCGVSENPIVKADLHIREKLVQRMKTAGESMDDESIKDGFLTGEQEAIQTTIDFEQGQEKREFEEQDDLDAWTGGDVALADQENPSFHQNENIKELESFYDSDIEFAKEALNHLNIEFKSSKNDLTIELTNELRFELDEAPREVTDGEFIKLQFNKKEMEKEIKESIQYNEWPTSQWASDFHPMMELIKGHCLDLFPGDETPVVFYDGDANEHKMGFLLQGVLHNKQGQILFEEWAVCTFDSLFKDDATPYGPWKISKIKEWTGLEGKNVVNPQNNLSKRLEQKICERACVASAWMMDVMEEKRSERGEKEKPRLKEEMQRLQTWELNRKKAIEAHLSVASKDSSVAGNFLKSEWEQEKKAMNEVSQEYGNWISDHFSTNKTPVIRIMGVFINAGKK